MHPPHPASRHRIAYSFALALASLGHAQAPPSAPGQPLTLNVQSRLVLEDVLVFDRAGQPVFDLPQSAFHLTDNGYPQTIQSFDQGSTATPPPSAPLPPGTFSNISSTSDQSAVAVILIDADSMAVTDQMYLLQELKHSLSNLPPALELAVFRVINGRIVQIRGFERDHADLERAFRECLPVISRFDDGDLFNSAVNQLVTVASYLQGMRGRKNLLWFAGSFPLVTFSDFDSEGYIRPDIRARERLIHELQEALAEARISVYPIDVRGVISFDTPAPGFEGAARAVTNGAAAGPNPAAASGVTRTPRVDVPGSVGVVGERSEMRNLASATGGRAYTLNLLGPEIAQAYTLGTRAYTLAYSPTPYTTDESWHHVRISADAQPGQGPYTLSYRPGYLATWTGVPGGRVGMRLDSDGTRVRTGSPGAIDVSSPLPFQVHIVPSSAPDDKQKDIALSLDFLVPIHDLAFKQTASGYQTSLIVASYAYSSDGHIRGGRMQQIDGSFTNQNWPSASKKQLHVHQSIQIPRNAAYVMMEIRDSGNGRVGTLMLSSRVIRTLSTNDNGTEPNSP